MFFTHIALIFRQQPHGIFSMMAAGGNVIAHQGFWHHHAEVAAEGQSENELPVLKALPHRLVLSAQLLPERFGQQQ